MSKNYARRRVNLFKKYPYCHWCDLKLTLDGNPNGRGSVPKNFATLDHLRSRLHPSRTVPNPACEERIVLACPACNQKRSDEENTALAREDQWRRSGAYPVTDPRHVPYVTAAGLKSAPASPSPTRRDPEGGGEGAA